MKRPGLLSHTAKTLILVLYVSFFIVQLFNFDIANSSNNATLFSSYKKIEAGHHVSVIKKKNTAKDKKQTTRLNKRFKPQTLLTYCQVGVKSPVYHLEGKTFASHSDIVIPASFLLPQSFRGPPVVA